MRVLGVEYFGLLAFATATITYFNIITDYGFKLSATKEISIRRDNKPKVIEIFSSVMIIKFFLLLICLAFLSILVFSFEKFSKDWLIYFLAFGTVIGQVLFPVWFFLGMEKMKYITYLNILAKSIFTITIFLFIKEQSDFYIVPILTSIGSIVAGLWSLTIIKKEFGIGFKFQTLDTLKYYIREANHFFISNVAISFYTVSTTFVLGLFTNNTIVGYFAASNKLIKLFKSPMQPVSQALYPYISKKVHISKENGIKSILNIGLYVGISTGILSLFIFLFASELVNLILGEQYRNSIIILKIMSVLPFLVGISNVYAVLGLYVMGYQKLVSNFIVKISLFHIVFGGTLIYYYNIIGAAVAIVITELIVSITSIIYFNTIKKKYL